MNVLIDYTSSITAYTVAYDVILELNTYVLNMLFTFIQHSNTQFSELCFTNLNIAILIFQTSTVLGHKRPVQVK